MLSAQPVSRVLGILLLAVLVLLAAATRRQVLNAQRVLTPDGSIPFTLESALAFRRIQMAYREGALPHMDRGIQYPRGVIARELDTLGAEPLYAALARRWPGTLPLEEKIRWLHLAWFCLAIPGMYFWAHWLGGGRAGGFWAAAFYAVAISAVARSTGQELSHENHALPLILWHLAAQAWGRSRAGNFRARLAAGAVSAILAALALCAWDLVQFYLLLYFLLGLIRAVRGRLDKIRLWTEIVPLMAVLLAAGGRNPYLAAHGFLLSPVMALGWGILLAGAPVSQRQPLATRLLLALIPLPVCLVLARLYWPAYSHFASLLWAKLRFLNIRPADPALLTFEQRILWVPALHSTSWRLLWEWFPALLLLTAGAVYALLSKEFRARLPAVDGASLLFFLAGSLAAFVLFFRFHVWLAVFACGTLGWGAGMVLAAGGQRRRQWAMALLAAGWLLEASQPWRGPLGRSAPPAAAPRQASRWPGALFWGRPNVYALETEELMNYLRTRVAPEPVLANFGLSATIAAYGGCPVVLHPKFESPEIRQKVREYGETLFNGDENDFREWLEAHGTTVYVHSMGEFSEIQPGYQMRFMVNALQPSPHAAARLFEQRPEELRHFTLEFANRKYRVYRLRQSLTAARRARTLVEKAREAFERGELTTAEIHAAHARRLDAECAGADDILRQTLALRDAGFRADEDQSWEEPLPWAPAQPWLE